MTADPATDARDGEQPGARVIVVGGGIAGLVAARELALSGARVTLLEAAPELGGRISGEVLDGARIDVGAEAFATRGGGVRELIAELGIEHEIVQPAPLGSWVVSTHGAVPLPAAGAVGIPAAPLSRQARHALGLGGALRAAIEPLLPRRIGRDAETLDRLVSERLGSRVLERLVRPVALGVYSIDPAKLAVDAVPGLADAFARRSSLIAAARELRGEQTAAGGAVVGLRRGMTALVEALTAELRGSGVAVRTGVRVEALRRGHDEHGGWIVDPAYGEELHADAVVLAVPERAARALLRGLESAGEETVSSAVDSVAHIDAGIRAGTDSGVGAGAGSTETPLDTSLETAVEVVALVIDDARLDAAPRGTGALVAHDAKPHCTTYVRLKPPSAPDSQWLFAKALTHVTAKWAERSADRPAGHHVVRLSYGRAGLPPETDALDDDAVRALALRDASRILGIELRPDSLRAMTRRSWRNGLPPTAVRRIATPRGVACVGDWVNGTGLASVVPGARRTARELLQSLTSSEPADPPSASPPAALAPALSAAAHEPPTPVRIERTRTA